jgi:hypothetical protein
LPAPNHFGCLGHNNNYYNVFGPQVAHQPDRICSISFISTGEHVFGSTSVSARPSSEVVAVAREAKARVSSDSTFAVHNGADPVHGNVDRLHDFIHADPCMSQVFRQNPAPGWAGGIFRILVRVVKDFDIVSGCRNWRWLPLSLSLEPANVSDQRLYNVPNFGNGHRMLCLSLSGCRIPHTLNLLASL